MNTSDELQYIARLARDAGGTVMRHYGQVERLTKTHIAASEEAVTEADRATQRLIVASLRERFPGDGIIGEESDAGTSITAEIADPMGRNWVIDPIDGTNNFIAGMGAFAVCIGLLDRGMPVLGVIYDVTRDQLYAGIVGNGDGEERRGTIGRFGAADAHRRQLAADDDQQPARQGRQLPRLGVPVDRADGVENAHPRLGGAGGGGGGGGGGARRHHHQRQAVGCRGPGGGGIGGGGSFTGIYGEAIWPFDLRNYQGAKVPFLAAAPAAKETLLAEIAAFPCEL